MANYVKLLVPVLEAMGAAVVMYAAVTFGPKFGLSPTEVAVVVAAVAKYLPTQITAK